MVSKVPVASAHEESDAKRRNHMAADVHEALELMEADHPQPDADRSELGTAPSTT